MVVSQLSGIAIPMLGGPVAISHLTPSTIRVVSISDAAKTVSQMLKEAVHYSSNEPLPEKNAEDLAAAFVQSFNQPQIFANCSSDLSGWCPVTDYTIDRFICGIDEDCIGCLLTIENE